MKALRAFRPSPAIVIAMIALLVALAGTGYAATRLPVNSVGTLQLRNNAVTSPKVKDRSLLKVDFAARPAPAGRTRPSRSRLHPDRPGRPAPRVPLDRQARPAPLRPGGRSSARTET